VERLALEVQKLGQLLLSAVRVLDPLGELALGLLDDLLLLVQRLGLLLQRVLALVQRSLPLMEILPCGTEFSFAFCLLLQRRFSACCSARSWI
jgi:hypothetical protein